MIYTNKVYIDHSLKQLVNTPIYRLFDVSFLINKHIFVEIPNFKQPLVI